MTRTFHKQMRSWDTGCTNGSSLHPRPPPYLLRASLWRASELDLKVTKTSRKSGKKGFNHTSSKRGLAGRTVEIALGGGLG